LRQPGKGRKKAVSSLRPTFEVLEDRTLMSVLPPPIVLGQTDISGLATLNGPGQGGNETTPVIAVDPLNPQKLIAAYNYSPTKPPPDSDPPGDQTSFVEASFSTDGGKNWTLFYDLVPNIGGDAAEMPSQSDPDQTLENADSPSVSFDRNGNVYLVYDEHSTDYT